MGYRIYYFKYRPDTHKMYLSAITPGGEKFSRNVSEALVIPTKEEAEQIIREHELSGFTEPVIVSAFK